MDRSVEDSFHELGQVDWTGVFERQIQHGAGRFTGTRYQRGHGFGAFLRGLRSFFASPVGRELIDLGKNVAIDVDSGERFTRSLPRRARQSVRNLIGVGKKRKHSAKTRKPLLRVIPLRRKRERRPIAISRSRATSARSPLFSRAG